MAPGMAFTSWLALYDRVDLWLVFYCIVGLIQM